MKEVSVEIKGDSGLLMNNIENIDLGGTKTGTKNYVPEIEAEKVAYRVDMKDPKSDLCVPERCLYSCFIKAGTYIKHGRSNLSRLLAGTIAIVEKRPSLNVKDYEIDIRTVIINRARVKKYRPLVENWKLGFTIKYNEEFLPDPEVIKEVIRVAGVKVGLLDYRPDKKGSFGKFTITKFKPKK